METLIKNYIDKSLISEILIKYFRAIDDKCLDLKIVESTFTRDAKIVRPNGSETVGHKNILEVNNESFARFKVTHHVTTDYIIELNDNTATLKANLTGMHLWADNDKNPSLNGKHFQAGLVLSAKAIKENDNWLLSELTYRNVWRIGEGISEMANFLKKQKAD